MDATVLILAFLFIVALVFIIVYTFIFYTVSPVLSGPSPIQLSDYAPNYITSALGPSSYASSLSTFPTPSYSPYRALLLSSNTAPLQETVWIAP